MRFLSFLVFVLIGSAGFSQQFAFEYWHDGKIVLERGDTLKGSIKYDLQNDLLQFAYAGRLESYTARKVLSFEIFDQTTKRYRQFYSIPYTTSAAYKAPVFFELLVEGKFTLLCRESIEYRSYSNTFYSYGTATRLVLVYHFFLLKENGTIQPFVGKRSDLVAMMGNNGSMVQKYIKANKLDITDRNDFTQIISYYNSL
ncbi:MAG: hypothetical protein SH819_12110 [Cytophagales bacterium]|nr:hypothetical protein [Cytophagales bacterium]